LPVSDLGTKMDQIGLIEKETDTQDKKDVTSGIHNFEF
jgi:hypothetical protein